MAEYFYNTRTHEVEEGRQSDWSQLMGPYATREEALQALERARARNDAWDAQDA
ncbi:SPOR domain-containing protein [Cellulomonas wangsupingiae]|nr:SPOR domain-containing protein [Cellulomonas wangsupingiae]MCM0638375.1 SPOR domain-containing protein [Cellulomonas wangsupingiae]